MRVFRPPGIKTTPSRLAELLGATLHRWPTRKRVRPRYTEDFLLTYSHPELFEDYHALSDETRTNLLRVSQFQYANKLRQRGILSESFPTPRTYSSSSQPVNTDSGGHRFVIRPLRHRGGEGFRISDTPECTPEEYIQEFYPKNREYRIITVKGEIIAVYYKSTPPGTPNDIPWNHEVSTFKTVNNWNQCFLSSTTIRDKITACPLLKGIHLAGIDILADTRNRETPYVLCEINLAPGLSIQNTLNGVRDAFCRSLA